MLDAAIVAYLQEERIGRSQKNIKQGIKLQSSNFSPLSPFLVNETKVSCY